VGRASAIAIDAATRKAQTDASDPRASAWVSANAGSGKTFVLARRVIRLLLAGTDPGRILCLTFTKAAAAQMATRVFEGLARWATMADAELARELLEVEGRKPDAGELARARRLFARALETPGGLKIQTIHAFCERLLHQFPFEANVAGHFEVLEERAAAALAEEARRSVLARAAAEPDGPLGQALAAVLASASDYAHELAVKAFVDKRDRVRAWITAAGSLGRALADLRQRLGLAEADTVARIRAAVLGECRLAMTDFARLLGLLRRSGKADNAAAERLAPILSAIDEAGRVAAYLDFCRKVDGDLRVATSLVTRAVKDQWPGLAEILEAEIERLRGLLDRLAAAECYESTAAMLSIADAAIHAYDQAKIARGVLDFEDLVVKTARLLTGASAAQWVHYKLDRGLDHILVDEAQDTSPRQWQVVRALVEEFFAGRGAAETVRTLFAVGDEKQSIFSFQGAVPAWFARMRDELGGRARAAGLKWADPQLHISFRSVQKVLAAVDTVFGSAAVHASLSETGVAPVHSAARTRDSGRVIVWPMIEPAPRAEPADWTTPLDHLGVESPEVRLANRIAKTIVGWLQSGEKLDTGEPIRAGGILVLARTRGAQTDAINRALKSHGIPIAGADRLALTEHIAVMDLMALGRVMLLPEDDLSLAAVLKSPLIGLCEEELYALAADRPASLWDGLGRAADLRAAEARARLEAWRSVADYLDPHAFFARILGPEKGRRRILMRLGAEAEDVLDEFLAQALAYEKSAVPSLEGFLHWLGGAETEIKRDTETLRDEVRVMTVHGAKGLEADVVFLVDTGAMPVHPSHDPKVVALDDDAGGRPGPLVWMRRLKAMPEPVEARVMAFREEARREYVRLLYVAMTRAKDRLIVCGTLKERGTDLENGWHGLVRSALEPECVRSEAEDGTLTALEWRPEPARRMKTVPQLPSLPFGPRRPEWLEKPAPPPPPALRRVSPSAALAGPNGEGSPIRPVARLDRESALPLERGRLVHRLLQSLPETQAAGRGVIAERYLAATAAAWPEADRAALIAQVLALLQDAGFAQVFAAGSRAEVDIAGVLPLGRASIAVSGRIDRLAVSADRVLIVDYKTNRPAPTRLADVPPAYVLQLALYRGLLQRLYPSREVAAAILWTDTPALMEIPSSTLAAALATMTEL
jgi:ATP-dependent helicase/nuclease subunit A